VLRAISALLVLNGRLYGDPMAILEQEQELRRIVGNAPPLQNISDE
jgi:hypothetical protein